MQAPGASSRDMCYVLFGSSSSSSSSSKSSRIRVVGCVNFGCNQSVECIRGARITTVLVQASYCICPGFLIC
jgi:hypothetical protein